MSRSLRKLESIIDKQVDIGGASSQNNNDGDKSGNGGSTDIKRGQYESLLSSTLLPSEMNIARQDRLNIIILQLLERRKVLQEEDGNKQAENKISLAKDGNRVHSGTNEPTPFDTPSPSFDIITELIQILASYRVEKLDGIIECVRHMLKEEPPQLAMALLIAVLETQLQHFDMDITKFRLRTEMFFLIYEAPLSVLPHRVLALHLLTEGGKTIPDTCISKMATLLSTFLAHTPRVSSHHLPQALVRDSMAEQEGPTEDSMDHNVNNGSSVRPRTPHGEARGGQNSSSSYVKQLPHFSRLTSSLTLFLQLPAKATIQDVHYSLYKRSMSLCARMMKSEADSLPFPLVQELLERCVDTCLREIHSSPSHSFADRPPKDTNKLHLLSMLPPLLRAHRSFPCPRPMIRVLCLCVNANSRDAWSVIRTLLASAENEGIKIMHMMYEMLGEAIVEEQKRNPNRALSYEKEVEDHCVWNEKLLESSLQKLSCQHPHSTKTGFEESNTKTEMGIPLHLTQSSSKQRRFLTTNPKDESEAMRFARGAVFFLGMVSM